MSTSTRQSHHDCLSPVHHHCQMVHLPDETRDVISQSSTDGLTFEVVYVALRSGRVEFTTLKHIAPDVSVFFVVSRQPHWYYIVEYSSYTQRFKCSCHQPGCDHIQPAKESKAKERAAYVAFFNPCGL